MRVEQLVDLRSPRRERFGESAHFPISTTPQQPKQQQLQTAMDQTLRTQLAPHSFQQLQQRHSIYQSHSPQCAVSTVADAHHLDSDDYEASTAATDWNDVMLMHPPPVVSLRRSSSADIPIPQFMIPCSVSQLMNKRYALASSSAARVDARSR